MGSSLQLQSRAYEDGPDIVPGVQEVEMCSCVPNPRA